MDRNTRRRRATQAGAAAVVLSVLVGVSHLLWPPGYDALGGGGGNVLLWLHAPRDMGRLPSGSTFCSGAAHCWLLQEASGDATDTVSGPQWAMSPQNTPRQGVLTWLPVADATGWVDVSSEKAAWMDGQIAGSTKHFRKTSVSNGVTNLVSVTVVANAKMQQAQSRIIYAHTTADATKTGFQLGVNTSGYVYATVIGSSTKTAAGTTSIGDRAFHCITAVIDGRTASAAKIYIDGTEDTMGTSDLSGTGTWDASGTASIGAAYDGTLAFPGGVARVRVDPGVVHDHALLCGQLWQAPWGGSTQLQSQHLTYTHSGVRRCYPTGASTAVCTPGGKLGMVVDDSLGASTSLRLAWPIDDRNQCIYGANDLSGLGWQRTSATCTADAAVAPDGSYTANSCLLATSGYVYSYATTPDCTTAASAVYPNIWVMCATADFTILLRNKTDTTKGQWNVDCSVIGANAWFNASPRTCPGTGCTQTTAWVGVAGVVQLIIQHSVADKTAYYWLPTISADPGYSAIWSPSGMTDTGAASWTISNPGGRYYRGGKGHITLRGNWLSGACVDVYDASNIGRSYGNATDWLVHNAAGDATPVAQCDLVLSGVDTGELRWNSQAPVSGTAYAQTLLNSVAQTCDSTPLAQWSAATPAEIRLDGYAATSCTANLQTVKIEAVP